MIKRCHIFTLLILCLFCLPAEAAFITITDALGRQVTVPEHPERVICSGPGCLRLLSYLQCQEKVIAVDSLEKAGEKLAARPYILANPGFRELPQFGEFRGRDNPELILGLDPLPQIIFKTYPSMGYDPTELQQRTGIPVVVLEYGNLGAGRAQLNASLRLMGKVLGRSTRAEEIIAFFDLVIADLKARTGSIPATEIKTCYIGGVAYRGPLGILSTEPSYPPFSFVNAKNVAASAGTEHAEISREKLLSWDPEIFFVDLASLQLPLESGVIFQLKNDPVYRGLSSLKHNRVFSVAPYNLYTKNFGSVLINAYFIGKTLYPDRFRDINIQARADEIYSFLLGKPVFSDLNLIFDNQLFTQIKMD